MKVYFVNPNYPNKRLQTSILKILETTRLCSIATVGRENKSHINTAYFCYNDILEIYFLSDPNSTHCHNIARRPNVAMTIFDSNQPWDQSKCGLQLFGTCKITGSKQAKSADALYKARFPSYAQWVEVLNAAERKGFTSRFYIFRPTQIKILDENDFGEETYVVVRLIRKV